MEIKAATMRDDGSIDCRVDHPEHGWIPYTARSDDPDERGRKIYAIVRSHLEGKDPPVVGDDMLQPPSPEELLRRARVAAKVDKLALVRGLREAGHWDAFKAALAQAGSDVAEDWELAGSIARMDPAFLPIMYHIGMSDGEIDAAFGVRA